MEDRIVGTAALRGKLRIIRSKANQKRFVGCEAYPSANQTYPLPQRGEVCPQDEICTVCGSPPREGGGRPNGRGFCALTGMPHQRPRYKAERAAKEGVRLQKEAGESATVRSQRPWGGAGTVATKVAARNGCEKTVDKRLLRREPLSRRLREEDGRRQDCGHGNRSRKRRRTGDAGEVAMAI